MNPLESQNTPGPKHSANDTIEATGSPKRRVQRLQIELDAFCDDLLATYQGLVATMVEVGEMDSEISALILKKLRERDPNLGELFESARLRFDSILMLSDGAISILLKYLDQDRLPMALIGTSEEVRHQFFRNMSNHSIEQMKEAIGLLGPVRASVVRQAQLEILESIRKLERNGAIGFGEDREDFCCG